MLKNFDNTLPAVVSFGAVAQNRVVIFCHALKRTNGNKIAVDVATIAVCANCVERLMPLLFEARQTNATSAEITPAKGAFVAKVKPEHGEQRALKNFFRQFATRQINATSAEITPAKGAFVANVKPEHIELRALKNFFRRFATNTNATTLQYKTALTGETFAFSRRLQFFVANVCAVTKRVCVAVR